MEEDGKRGKHLTTLPSTWSTRNFQKPGWKENPPLTYLVERTNYFGGKYLVSTIFVTDFGPLSVGVWTTDRHEPTENR